MKYLNNITFTLFIKDAKIEEEETNKLLSLIPFSLEEEKLVLKRSASTGLSDNTIIILTLKLEKERHTNAFLSFLQEHLSKEQKELLLTQENRLDDNCDFFIRFKKDDLPNLIFTDEGDCVHIRMSVAAFPKKKERALERIKEIFK